MRQVLASISMIAVVSCSAATPRATSGSTSTAATPAQRFDRFAREYFETRYRFSPLEATYAGVHTYDAALDDVSP